MSRTEMLMVFCYDISTAKVRRRVAAHLEDHATRVQGSVFEARMRPDRARLLADRLATDLEDGDSLRLYAISSDGQRHSLVRGSTIPLAEDQDFWLV